MLVEANRGRKASERSAAAKWSMLYETSLVKSMRAELAWMEASEEEKVDISLQATGGKIYMYMHTCEVSRDMREVAGRDGRKRLTGPHDTGVPPSTSRHG